MVDRESSRIVAPPLQEGMPALDDVTAVIRAGNVSDVVPVQGQPREITSFYELSDWQESLRSELKGMSIGDFKVGDLGDILEIMGLKNKSGWSSGPNPVVLERVERRVSEIKSAKIAKPTTDQPGQITELGDTRLGSR